MENNGAGVMGKRFLVVIAGLISGLMCSLSALSAARLAERASEKEEGGELDAIARVLRELSTTLDLGRIFDVICDEAMKGTGAHYVDVVLVDKGRQAYTVKALKGYPVEVADKLKSVQCSDEGIRGKVIRIGEPILMPEVDEELLDAALIERYERFFKVRKEVQRQIEELRKERKIGSSLEAEVRLFAEDEHLARFLSSFGEEFLSELLIVSAVEIAESKDGLSAAREMHGLYLEALPSRNAKCERCWRQRLDVGSNPQFPKLCQRCASVVASFSVP